MARPSTYSIVACDLEAAEWGVAVQSKFLAVGAGVPAAEPHVGAIATQALANMRYGPDGLALLRQSLSAQEVVARLTEADEGRAERQLGVVDAQGRAATYTGESCLDWAGGITGEGYAAQGNILVSEETVSALARTFEEAAGKPLAERLLDALVAAQGAGGDRRGQQSAALLVVAWKSHIAPAARTATITTTPTTLDRIGTLLAARLAAAADYGIVPVAEQLLFRVRRQSKSLAAP